MPTLRPYTSMSRTRLAQLYCPDVTPRHAWRTLKVWMDRCHPLIARLRSLGYDGRQRILSPAMVAAIAEYLGEP